MRLERRAGDTAPREAAAVVSRPRGAALQSALLSRESGADEPGASCWARGEAAADLLCFSSCDNEITYLYEHR